MLQYVDKITDLIAPQVEGLEKEEIRNMIEIPADSKMGDYAFPCFKLAKILRKAPPLIAKGIAEAIADDPVFEKVEPVNAYVNMFIDKEGFAKDVISDVIEEGEDFGKSSLGDGKTVIVEYSSPNIAKPFHIGHIRSTVIGASIARIYDYLGYDVVRINHLGDYGTQFGKMIVAYRHWGNREDVVNEPIKTLLGYYTKFHEEAEKDPSLEDEARATFTKLENGGRTAQRKRPSSGSGSVMSPSRSSTGCTICSASSLIPMPGRASIPIRCLGSSRNWRIRASWKRTMEPSSCVWMTMA